MISTDLYSQVLDAAAYVFLNVFPLDREHVAIFSYRRDERLQAHTAYGDIWDASGDHQKYLLSKLILRRCSNFVIAPRLFEKFSEPQKEAMRAYFDANIHPRSVEVEDSRLFLSDHHEARHRSAVHECPSTGLLARAVLHIAPDSLDAFMRGGQSVFEAAVSGERCEWLHPGRRWRRHDIRRRMRSTSAKRCVDCRTHADCVERLVLQNQNEIHEISHATVRRLAWTCVRVKLLRPMLLDRKRRHDNGRNAGECEPVFALDGLERLKDFVSDSEVDVKLHERSTVETAIDRKPRAALGSLIQFGHRLAHDEREEVG